MMLSKPVIGVFKKRMAEHFNGNALIGYSVDGNILFGKRLLHFNADGSEAGYSKQGGGGIFNPTRILTHFDAAGREIGYSKRIKDGVAHFNASGQEIGQTISGGQTTFLMHEKNSAHTNSLPIPFLATQIYRAGNDIGNSW
jgi:hypothetical protein